MKKWHQEPLTMPNVTEILLQSTDIINQNKFAVGCACVHLMKRTDTIDADIAFNGLTCP